MRQKKRVKKPSAPASVCLPTYSVLGQLLDESLAGVKKALIISYMAYALMKVHSDPFAARPRRERRERKRMKAWEKDKQELEATQMHAA